MPQLEFGDKIVLPPILAFAGNPEAKNGNACVQYCSVQEFSAPTGQVFLPYWMMQNLHVDEGAFVLVSNTIGIPRAIYCRLQPEKMQFLDLAAQIGPKLLMESAMRRYSVLSVDETIVIEYGTTRYYLRVLELKPAAAVSLCGDVDLDMDFTAPETDVRRPHSAVRESQTSALELPPVASVSPSESPQPENQSDEAHETKSAPDAFGPVSYGRRLGDGRYVNEPPSETPSQDPKQKPAISSSALQRANSRLVSAKCAAGKLPVSTTATASSVASSVLAKDILLAQAAFTTPGYALGHRETEEESNHIEHQDQLSTGCGSKTDLVEPSSTEIAVNACPLCLAELTSANRELHLLRCAKNPAYHKFECAICHVVLRKSMEQEHLHCDQCSFIGSSTTQFHDHRQEQHTAVACDDCRVIMPRALLSEHVQTQCQHALELCSTCGFKFKRKDFQAHVRACTSRTERCETCNAYIQVTEISEHTLLCTLSSPEHHDEIESDVLDTCAIPKRPKALGKQQQPLTCGYCAKGGFQTPALLQHHISQSFSLAKSFRRDEEASSSNQEQIQDIQPSVAIQGRLRRQSDAHSLKASARAKKKPIVPFSNTTKLPIIPNARAAAETTARPVAKAHQTTLVAISGTAMTRIHELSQQQPTATPAFHCISNSLTSQRSAVHTPIAAAAGRPSSISIRPQRLGR